MLLPRLEGGMGWDDLAGCGAVLARFELTPSFVLCFPRGVEKAVVGRC